LAEKQGNDIFISVGGVQLPDKITFPFVDRSKDEIAQFRLGNFSARGVAG
jgi:hypothetical protein